MKSFLANWKTTLSGAITALIGIGTLVGVHIGDVPVDRQTAVGMIIGGLGLIFAKDGNVTGGTKQV